MLNHERPEWVTEMLVVQRQSNIVMAQLAETIGKSLIGANLDFVRHGVDICNISEMAEAIGDEGFTERYFTEQERLHCGRSSQRYAVNFAMKEAVIKVVGHLPRWLTEIEIGHEPCGAPLVNLSGKAQAMRKALGIEYFAISGSHEGNIALASCLGFGLRRQISCT